MSVDFVLRQLEKAFKGAGEKNTTELVKSFDTLLNNYGFKGQTSDQWMVNLARHNPALAKSMGIDANTGQQISGTSALQLENLDPIMTEVLLTEGEFKKTNALPRTPSPNVFPEWNKKNSFGAARSPGGFAEGSKPSGGVAAYQRNNARIRFWGEEGGVTHQASVSSGGMFLDPTAEEERNTTIRLLEKVERATLHGDSAILGPDGSEVNYDGIIKQLETLRPASVIDMDGASLGFDDLQNFARQLRVEGKLTNFNSLKGFATPDVMSDLGDLNLEKERANLGAPKATVVSGTPFSGFNSQHGFLPFETDIVMHAVDNDEPLLAAQLGASDAPTTVTGTAAAVGGGESSDLPAATYYYFVSSFNAKGESATTASAGVAATLGQKVTLAITKMTGALGYRIYRSTVNSAATARLIKTVPQPAGGSVSFVDFNVNKPGLGSMILFNANPQDVTLYQLAPLTKWPLAIVDTTVRFLLLMYHTIVVKSPERFIYVKNIGRNPSA